MASIKVVYKDSLPRDIRAQVNRLLPGLLKYAPVWLAYLGVSFDANPKEEDGKRYRAQIFVLDQYREASLVIYPPWTKHDEDSNRVCLLHELMHPHTAPLYHEGCRIINSCTEEGTVEHTHMMEVLKHFNEMVVEDFTQMLLRNE